MLLEKSVWRRRVLGQDGVSREMMGKNLQVCLCSMPGSQGVQLPCAGMDFPPPDTPWSAGGHRSFSSFSWELREKQKSIFAGKEY